MNINNFKWYILYLSFLGDSVVKKPPAKQEMWVQSPCGKNPLEKKMATHSSIAAWEILWTKETGPWGLQRHDSVIKQQHSTIIKNIYVVPKFTFHISLLKKLRSHGL